MLRSTLLPQGTILYLTPLIMLSHNDSPSSSKLLPENEVQMTPATVSTVVLSNCCLVLMHVLYRHMHVLGKGQFGFRRGKGTRDAIGMLRIISERILYLDEVCLHDKMAEGI
jgi:hypothetical protein